MASLLRQLVAGPRLQHADTGLDLCYVSEEIIVTSGPSNSYPKRAYRTPLPDLVSYLDEAHGADWAIWEFRAEGTGYPDSVVYDRIMHFPWPDHQPPPFRLVPVILASMRNWLAGGKSRGGSVSGVDGGRVTAVDAKQVTPGDGETGVRGGAAKDAAKGGRVVVVHCKAGKGRSGTMSCSFLIAERGWAAADALARFTERRMRTGFGEGVSIPSQQRWITYVDRWAANGKRYADRKVQILEVHVWGARDGVRVEVEGYEGGGKKIGVFHRFSDDEGIVIGGPRPDPESERTSGTESPVWNDESLKRQAKDILRSSGLLAQTAGKIMARTSGLLTHAPASASSSRSRLGDDSVKDREAADPPPEEETSIPPPPEVPGLAIIFRPSKPVVVPTSDVKVSIVRRARPHHLAPIMIMSVAHVWFNAFFEGQGPELGEAERSGVFEVSWDEMDGLKGFMRVGTRAFERMAVVWKTVGEGEVIVQPGVGEDISGAVPADWRGEEGVEDGFEAEVEREVGAEVEEVERAGLKTSGPACEEIENIERQVGASSGVGEDDIRQGRGRG